MAQNQSLRIAALVVGFSLVGCGRKSQPTPAPEPDQVPPGGAADAPDFDKTLDPKRHNFLKHRFSMRFPKEFVQQPAGNPNTLVLVANPARTANINVRVTPAGLGDSLDSIAAASRQGITSKADNPIAGGDGEFTVRGLRCKWLSLTHGPPEKRVEVVVYLIKRETDVVMVFGTTAQGGLATYRPAFDDSVRSIQFE